MTSFYRSTFLAETPTTSYQRSTFSKGNLDEIDNTTFTPMLLSTIICPQYLRGVGVCGRLRVPSSSMPSPFVVHRHSSKRRHPYSHPLHVCHTLEKQRHIITSSYVLRRHREHKQHKMYYLCITHIVIFAATRCISILWTLCI